MMVTLTQLRDYLPGDLVPTQVTDLCPEFLNLDILGRAYLDKFEQTCGYFFSACWSECLDLCDTMLDITWEHLNTGHWKDVNITWRHTYTLFSWLKALAQYARSDPQKCNGICEVDRILKERPQDNSDTESVFSIRGEQKQTNFLGILKKCVKTCDMGLLMGAPVKGNILTKLVSEFQKKYTEQLHTRDGKFSEQLNPSNKKQKITNFPDLAEKHKVPVHSCPSLEYFQRTYMNEALPVTITDCMDFWPAMGERRWSLDYIRKIAGCRTVPIEIGSKYTEDSWSQSLMTIEDFISKFIVNPSMETGKGYLAQHQLFDQVPELRKDISVPSYCGIAENDDVDINAWFGPEGTISPMHHDPKHNLLCQVVGEKYIRLYAEVDSAMVYPHDSPLFSNTSQVDVEKPDLERFPDFAKAPYQEYVLRPGQMLYIPPRHWHYIRSLSISFSVSFWWE